MRQMQADLSSLFLQTLLIWFLSFQYYGSYGKKSAKNSTFLCKVAPIDGMELSSIEVQQTAPYMITAILVLLLFIMLLILLQSLLHYLKVIIRGNYIFMKVRHIFINPIINVIHSNYYIMQGNGHLVLKDFHRSRLASILSAKKFTENWSVRGLSIPQLTISKFLSCEVSELLS